LRVNIKPLSVNLAWQGKRFKTPKYKQYQIDVLMLLRPFKMPEPPYKMYYEFGFSNSASDIDNPVKLFQDILSKKYGFDDKLIHEIRVIKTKVKKGQEYIEFNIDHYENSH